MRRKALPPGAVEILLFLAGLVSSCAPGGDDGNPIAPSDPPPALPTPYLEADPRLASADPAALEAGWMVIGQLNMVRLLAQTSESTASTMNSHAWSRSDPNCWNKDVGDPEDTGCRSRVLACGGSGQYEWSNVWDGLCPLDVGTFVTFVQWTKVRGTTSADGRSGHFLTYAPLKTKVDHAWSWEITPDRRTGRWDFYRGGTATDSLVASMQWTRDANSFEDSEWTWRGTGKWRAHVSDDGFTGDMTIYQWTGSGWSRRHEIRWADTHGGWETLDSSGQVTQTRTW